MHYDIEFIKNISPENNSLNFLFGRLHSDKYRGNHRSQHNRMNLDKVTIILGLLSQTETDFLIIRTKDLSRRPYNTEEEQEYALFCEMVKSKMGSGSQDSIRKNLFVDLNRMGLIHRYTKNKELIPPYTQNKCKYVKISDLGRKLLNAKNEEARLYIYSKCVDILLGGMVNVILNILMDQDNNIKHITHEEYMFFVSAVDNDFFGNLSVSEVVELLKSYRLLSRTQQNALIDQLQNTLKPHDRIHNKTDKRDYHNWKNESQQVFDLLSQLVYFELRESRLVLRATEFDDLQKKLNRSVAEKYKYWRQHRVKKTVGFELHHVVPLSWAENQLQFSMFDDWRNMVYIDAYSHAKITHNRNCNVYMELVDLNGIHLYDHLENSVELKDKENILYSAHNRKIMKEYNTELNKI